MRYHKTFFLSAFLIMSIFPATMSGSESDSGFECKITIENQCSNSIVIEPQPRFVASIKTFSITPIAINANDWKKVVSFRKMVVIVKSEESEAASWRTENMYLTEETDWLTIEEDEKGYIKINNGRFPLEKITS